MAGLEKRRQGRPLEKASPGRQGEGRAGKGGEEKGQTEDSSLGKAGWEERAGKASLVL